MSSMVIGYGLESMDHAGKAIDGNGDVRRISSDGTESYRTGRPSSRLDVYSHIENGSRGFNFFLRRTSYFKN